MSPEALTGKIGIDRDYCATEDHGMPCTCGTYDTERKIYHCAAESLRRCPNKTSDPEIKRGEENGILS